jgi:hypothetical protein
LTDKEYEFHRSRQIFLVYKGKLFLAEPNLPWTHLQYMISEGIVTHDRDPEYENVVRGYYMHGALYAYMGHDFRAPRGMDLRPAFRELAKRLNLPDDTQVSFGVTKGEVGTQWHSPNGSHRLELVKWFINPEMALKAKAIPST